VLTRENRKHEWNNLFFFRRDEKRHFDILFWCNTKTLVGCANRMFRKPNSYGWNGVERHSRSRNNTRTIFDLVCKLNWLFIVIFSFLTTPAIKLHTNPYILPLQLSHVVCLRAWVPSATTKSRPWDGYSLWKETPNTRNEVYGMNFVFAVPKTG